MLNNVFVYGTLKEGQSNDRPFYREKRVAVKRAVVVGTLYNFGPFPGLVLKGDTVVQGEVHTYKAEEMKQILKEMDRLEGYTEDRPEDANFYNRRTVDILLENGEKLRSYLYEVNHSVPKVRQLEEISSGVWQPKIR